MLTRFDIDVASIEDRRIKLEALLHVPDLQRQWTALLDAAVDRAIVLMAAEREGLRADVAEMQTAVNGFRHRLGLGRAEQTRQWLEQRHLTLDDLQEEGRYLVLREKLLRRLLDPQVDRYFHEHRSQFAQVALARVLVEDENMAAELFAELEEGETGFEDLVLRRSIDPSTAWRGGYWGEFRRRDLAGEVESAVFGAPVGTVVGPFLHRDGWMLIKILGRREERLDDPTRASLRSTLLAAWLAEQRQSLGIAHLVP